MIKARPRNNLMLSGMDPREMRLSKKKVGLLKKSRAGRFREQFLPNLPVAPVAKHFNRPIGRPTKALFTTTGACVLQQIFDLTDSELQAQLAFNQQWHYALDIADQDDHVKVAPAHCHDSNVIQPALDWALQPEKACFA